MTTLMARDRQRWQVPFRSLCALSLSIAFGCGSRGQIPDYGGELGEQGGSPVLGGGQAGNAPLDRGGSSTGGAHHGGASAGGVSHGGASSGGASFGGASFGGAWSGGASSGGASHGGASHGGVSSGGASFGGVAGFGSGGTAPGLNCVVNGVIYPDGARGIPAPDGCNTCDCRMGQLTSCTLAFCPASSCVVNGQVFASGTSMPDPASCNSCVCDNGSIGACTEIFCPLPPPCQIGRAYYRDGYGYVTSDGSTQCTCHAGKMACGPIP